ncbi:hypothetical protein I316_07209 [Kwoniella heveanensis BCC8398]|uniref:Uncharacterized protein n=1 Tax=Kwoniella heveanensis BCC8398 TaxID=1296120 RepID=A0A1B9GJ99_9TREE|nr:hypothetical protein I316_07209 [Kwoniella heveanensis BCC8398]
MHLNVEYDLENLKSRAYASPKQTQHVKVYLPSTSSFGIPSSPYPITSSSAFLQPETPTPSGSGSSGQGLGNSSMFEMPMAKPKQRNDRKGKGKEVVPVTASGTATPRAADQQEAGGKSNATKKGKAKKTPAKQGKATAGSPMLEALATTTAVLSSKIPTGSTTPSSSVTPAKSKKRKRDDPTPEPTTLDEPASNLPNNDASSSTHSRKSTSPKKKRVKKNKTDPKSTRNPASLKQPLESAQPTPPAPSPASAIPASFNRYKPNKPSPLGRVSEPPEETVQGAQTPLKARKQRQRGKKKNETGSEPIPELPASNRFGVSDSAAELEVPAQPELEEPAPPQIARPRPASYVFPLHPILLSFPELLYHRPPEADPRFSSSAIDRTLDDFALPAVFDDEESQHGSEVFEEEEVAPTPDPDFADDAGPAKPGIESVGPARPTSPPAKATIMAEGASKVMDAGTSMQPNGPEEAGGNLSASTESAGRATRPDLTQGRLLSHDAHMAEQEVSISSMNETADNGGSGVENELPVERTPQVQAADNVPNEGEKQYGAADTEVDEATDNITTLRATEAAIVHQPSSPTVPISPLSTSSFSASDNARIRTHIHSNHHVALAARGQCVICAGPPHLQKDCPTVKEGLDSLRVLLDNRKQEIKTLFRDSSIEAIEAWVERLHRITNSVKGIKPIVSPSIATRVSSAIAPPSGLQVNGKKSPSTTIQPPAASSPTPSTSPESVRPIVASPPLLNREHSLPPIHLKALASKAGSVSGLSVSDAVIETGSSASESEDSQSGSDDDDESISGHAQDSDTESTSSKLSSRSGSSTSSTRSSNAGKRLDVTKLDSQASLMDFLTAPLSQKQKRSARLSAAHMHDIDYEGAQDASDIEDSPERVPATSQANRIRRGSESSVGEFEEEVLVPGQAAGDDGDDDVLPFSQAPSLWPIRGDTESIEPETTDEPVSPALAANPIERHANPAASPRPSDQTRRSLTDMAQGSSPSLFIAELPGSIALQEAIEEDAAPERWVDQPFLSENGLLPPSSTGSSTHEVHDWGPSMRGTQVLESLPESQDPECTPRPLMRRVTRSKAIQEKEEPNQLNSVNQEEEPMQLDSAINIHLGNIPASSQVSDRPASPPRRRLRSASREPTIEPPPLSPRVGSTSRRIFSASQPTSSSPGLSRRLRSQSPSSSLPVVRRSARHTTPLDQIDELAASPAVPARRSTRRGTTPLRSSQVDELESSPPLPTSARIPGSIPEEEDGEDDEQQGQITQVTPDALVPETQLESESASLQPRNQTPSQARRSLRSHPSPLFMTQGSQIPQTQAYNLYPSLSSSEIGLGETPRAKTAGGGGIGLLSSPISEKRLVVPESKGMNGTTPLGRRVSFKASSPIIEEAEESDDGGNDGGNDNANGDTGITADHDHNGDHLLHSPSSSEDENERMPSVPLPPPARRQLRHSISTPSLYPALPLPSSRLPRTQSASQPSPVSLFPTLGSLPREQLRSQFVSLSQSDTAARKPRASLPANMMSMSQPSQPTATTIRPGRASFGGGRRMPVAANGKTANGIGRANGSESDSSGSSDSDSDEEKTPAGLKGRIARGDQNKRKKRVSGQPPVVRW